jgi:hypothetical protein
VRAAFDDPNLVSCAGLVPVRWSDCLTTQL